MSENSDIFSVRLVVVDFYLEKPISGLDICYSEFRGAPIKKVPIIRIFGSNSHGQKTCLHVHGVFPYFYIPYERYADFESLSKAIYQIALSLDKAINISLGQANSAAQHVFKVQLVKGIPFYGYHRVEHQYLKIYMYNPRFVRRAANLLQNGSILGKIFHPHESHVPYVLQFMIDYNLYGMSFLHVPLEIVKLRRNGESMAINYKGLKATQILHTDLVKKQSCCALEVDIGSNFILNRFQMAVKNTTSKHSNPGIEAIWHDEEIRRKNLIKNLAEDDEKIKAIPPLEIPPTQERPNVNYTESDTFYRVGLLSKLITLEETSSGSGSLLDQTMNSSLAPSQAQTGLNVTNLSNKEMRRTFNLKKLLANSVYPAECTPNDELVNASCIENHLSANSFFNTTNSENTEINFDSEPLNHTLVDESAFLEDTIVDEELILSLTQEQHIPLNASLRVEVKELLDVLEQLEEHSEQQTPPIDAELLNVLQQLEEQNENQNPIDLDSSLAPLSQPYNDSKLTALLEKETLATACNQFAPDNNSESEDEDNSNLHDFSIALDDIDEVLLKISQSQQNGHNEESIINEEAHFTVSQLDGVDDFLPRTPVKQRKAIKVGQDQITPPHSPKVNGSQRSPRTPKPNVAAKYTPLPIIINNRSITKLQTNVGSELGGLETKRLSFEEPSKRADATLPLHKKLAMIKMRRKTISSAKELVAMEEMGNTKSTVESTSVTTRRSRKKSVDLERTHITCALTPRRKSERLLKTCKVEMLPKNVQNGDANISEKEKTPMNFSSKKTRLRIKNKETADDLRKTNKQPEPIPQKYKLKKFLVRIARKDLKKLAAELQTDTISKRKSVKTTSKKILEPDKNTKIKPTIEAESIVKNLTDLNELFGKGKGNTQASESQFPCLKLSEDTESKNAIVNAGNDKVLDSTSKTPVDNLRKNLSQLTKLFQHLDSTKNPNHKVNYACDNTSDNEEEIAASDTESTPSKFKMKRISNLKRARRSFKIEPKTPKTPITNFCDISTNSPSVFSDYSSPVLTPEISPKHEKTLSNIGSKLTDTPSPPTTSTKVPQLNTETDAVVLKPLYDPPTREETLKACEKLQIYEYDFQCPFYSNPEDVTKAKEVGFTVLQIPGNKLTDLPEFQSILGANLNGLTSWRRQKVQEIGGTQALQRYKTIERQREFFATRKAVIIQPHIKAPTRHEAKIWIKARELIQNKNEATNKAKLQIEEDSPIKIRRQKVAMMFNDDTTANNEGDDLETTSCSLTLTPLTPVTPVLSQRKQKYNQTPLTSNDAESTASQTKSASPNDLRQRRSKRFKSIKTSLNEKLKAAADKEMHHQHDKSLVNELKEPESIDSLPSSQQSNRSTDDSSSVCSEIVLDEMERSSFVKRLKPCNMLGNKNQLDVSFGLTSASLNNTFGFKVNLENLQEAKADIECNNLTTIVLEVFVPTRDDLYPNPEFDEIRCIFYAIDNNVPPAKDANDTGQQQNLPNEACGYILVTDPRDIIQNEGKIHGLDADIEVKIVKSEIEALEALLALCAHWDADIYAGYEIEMSSWGYILERAKFLCLNIGPLLSRIPSQKMRDFVDEDRDSYTDLDIDTKICGRIMLDVWRLMRSEIALTSYTFENVMYHILHKRCPWHSYRDLTAWFASPCSRWIVLEYYLERVRGILALLDQLDLLGRTSEMAKLIGIQFYEVFSRGSQFRVESMMLRIAKPRNLVPLSPSVQQRAHMRAPEYLPLILEPQSRFYADPVIVLDFQSLYPSMIIGYNYCFSTCLGRVEHLGTTSPFEFGASQLRVSPKMLRKLIDEDLVNISPCGVVFVKPSVREGILPRMLTEILDTRQMVKQSMKLHKSNTALQRILHSRQLGLKLMANVTYGYTAANFSGRMPAVEVGDSVVAKGRETLERTIKMVESNEKWGVKVVYGDTDSLFVQVPGRNREQAFKIGEEIAEAATKVNPHPVKLKLEKVYQPCILQTKKRYVGYMYETPDQAEPVYEAKGIETVRRDGCPAVAKMLEKVLRILFETTDVSQIKQYVCRQFTKLLSGRANIQDLIFAKEFRGLNGYKPTACVPALELTRKWLQTDPRRIPRRGERVPFIITNGPPGVPLIRLIRTPHEVLADSGLKINAIYYITKAIIPPLNRCLLLIGADVNEWFANLPRKILMTPVLSTANEIISAGGGGGNQQHKKSTISQYFSTTNCIIDCGRQTKEGICKNCMSDATKCVITLETKISKIERAFHLTQHICQACCGRVGDLKCGSLDCPVLYVLEVKRRDLQQIEHFQKLLAKF